MCALGLALYGNGFFPKIDWNKIPVWAAPFVGVIFVTLFKFFTDNYYKNPKERERLDREAREKKLAAEKKAVDEEKTIIEEIRGENRDLRAALDENSKKIAELREQLRAFKSMIDQIAIIFEMGKENCPIQKEGGTCKIIEAVTRLTEESKK